MISAIAGPKPGWERRRGHTDSNMTLHTYSDTERNTPNTREGVSREGSVSPRGMREVTHGADASCNPPTVVAERTLQAAGLSPSGWPWREPYRQAFPSGGPAGRTRWNGRVTLSGCWRRTASPTPRSWKPRRGRLTPKIRERRSSPFEEPGGGNPSGPEEGWRCLSLRGGRGEGQRKFFGLEEDPRS